MRKALFALVLLAANLFLMLEPANAQVTAGKIFGMFGGTTSTDAGGALHSQTRSIYSLGGGQTSFQGKKVTLLAVDPPSFSAGCSGISWHFGGFSFISVDEIRQLVEAVAQASLGVAVDLAMQTLCPQCYAVMSKLRDIANAMRNAAADACKVAQNFGKILTDAGVFSPGGRNAKCSEISAKKNESASWLDAAVGQTCGLLDGAETAMSKLGADINSWQSGGATSDGKTPSEDTLSMFGNKTYRALDALGYKDGVAKDLMMSYLGMTIIVPSDSDCKTTFAYIYGSANSDSATTESERSLLTLDQKAAGQIVGSTENAKTGATDAQQKAATTDPTGAKRGMRACYVPPMLTGLTDVGKAMVCGFRPGEDAKRFAGKYFRAAGETDQTEMLARLAQTSLGELCNLSKLGDANSYVKDYANANIIQCEKVRDADCMRPRQAKLDAVLKEPGSGEYTGLAWMIMDALYQGVDAVVKNAPSLPNETKAVLANSGYPLYRLVNLAAVYPGMANELLQGYAAVISVQYVLDTLEQVTRVGAQPSIHEAPPTGVSPVEVTSIRAQIDRMYTQFDPFKNLTLRRMNEKRVLVESIVQVNRAVQSEVISRGLGANNNMAISLKQQNPDGKKYKPNK